MPELNRRHLRRAPAVAAALVLLAVPGAAAVGRDTAHEAPPLALADPQEVPGLELVERTAENGGVRTSHTYPVVEGAPGFGTEVRTAMAEAHTAFLRERDGGEPAELVQRSEPLAASGDVLGVRIAREASAGDGGPRTEGESLWFDGASGAVLPWTGLLRGPDAVEALDAEVARVLRERGGLEPGELPEGLESDGSAAPLEEGPQGGAGDAPEVRPGDAWNLSTELDGSPLGDLAFDTAGGLVVTVAGQRVAVPAGAAGGLLSEFGERARAAALSRAPLDLGEADGPARADLDCDRVPCVALTFDDGPSEHTGRLLDMLEGYSARATFYMLGSLVGESPELAARITGEGHEVGGHSWRHDDLTGMSASAVADDTVRTAEAIEEASGQWPHTMRPPYGSFNATTERSVGAPIVIWDVDTLDWKVRDAEKVADTAVEQTRPGSIVLMHDIHGTTVDAVPDILSRLHDEGYHFVTVSQLFSDLDMKKGGVYKRRE